MYIRYLLSQALSLWNDGVATHDEDIFHNSIFFIAICSSCLLVAHDHTTRCRGATTEIHHLEACSQDNCSRTFCLHWHSCQNHGRLSGSVPPTCGRAGRRLSCWSMCRRSCDHKDTARHTQSGTCRYNTAGSPGPPPADALDSEGTKDGHFIEKGNNCGKKILSQEEYNQRRTGPSTKSRQYYCPPT